MPESKRHSTGTAKKITKKKTASISLTESPVQSQAAFGGVTPSGTAKRGATDRASLEPASAPWRGERAFAQVAGARRTSCSGFNRLLSIQFGRWLPR